MSRLGSRISSDRVAKTPVKEPGGTGHTGWLTDEALLQMPKPKTRTEEEKRRAEAEAALEALGAAFEVADITARRHGCTHLKHGDPPCRKRGHAADVAAAGDVIEALGLGECRVTRLRPGA